MTILQPKWWEWVEEEDNKIPYYPTKLRDDTPDEIKQKVEEWKEVT